MAKFGDLKPVLLAVCLARLHPALTEIALMRIGGELWELRRKKLQDFRISDTSQSLELRLNLATELAHAEKAWRSSLMQVLNKGQVFQICISGFIVFVVLT